MLRCKGDFEGLMGALGDEPERSRGNMSSSFFSNDFT